MNSMEMSVILFKAVLQASVAATILGLIVLVIERVLRKRLSPAWLFALYLPVLLRLLWPVFPEAPTSIFNFPQWVRHERFHKQQTLEQVQSQDATSIPVREINATPLPMQTIPLPEVSTTASPTAFTLMQILSLVWLAVTLALLLRLAGGAWRLKRLLPKHSVAATELEQLLAGLGSEVRAQWTLKLIETPLWKHRAFSDSFVPGFFSQWGLRGV